MNISYIIGQSLGLIALCVGLTVFLQRSDRKLKYRLALYTAIMSCHFFLLNAYPAGISTALNSTRTIVSIYYRRVLAMYVFMLLAMGLSLFKLTHGMELLPIAGTLMSTYAFFKLRGLKMRYLMWVSTLCWTIYNIWLGSIGGSMIEGIFLIMNGVTTYRLRKLVLNGQNPFI